MDNKNIIERILKATGSKTQRELAKVLEVPEQSITDYKKKSGVPATWLIKLCASHKINPNWIQTGVGPMYVEGKAERGHEVLENQEEYSCPSKGGKVEEDENGELTVPVLAKPSVDEYNYVPMVEAQLSAGGGSFMASERIKDYYAFRKPFIANVAKSPKN